MNRVVVCRNHLKSQILSSVIVDLKENGEKCTPEEVKKLKTVYNR